MRTWKSTYGKFYELELTSTQPLVPHHILPGELHDPFFCYIPHPHLFVTRVTMLRRPASPFARSQRLLWRPLSATRCTPMSGGPLKSPAWMAASTTSPSLTTTPVSPNLCPSTPRTKPFKLTRRLQLGHPLNTGRRSSASGRTMGGVHW